MVLPNPQQPTRIGKEKEKEKENGREEEVLLLVLNAFGLKGMHG